MLDVPSFSVAKTAVAGVALMHMELRAPGTAASTVADLVPATGCRNEAWRDVRLVDRLHMATGHDDSPAYMADEDAPKVAMFFGATTHPHKLAFACEAYPR